MPITHPVESLLPLLDKFGAEVPSNLDVYQTASEWLQAFKNFCESGDVDNLADLVVEGAYWRDVLAFTWSFRTFEGVPKIKQFLRDRLAQAEAKSFKLKNPSYAELQRPFPDLAWIQAMFEFETNVGPCSGIVRLVPQASGKWKAHTILTTLEALNGFPEHLRESRVIRGNWNAARAEEQSYADRNPTVLIIGGGHCGLHIAARLKYLGVDTLIVEKNERIGDNWRNRYDALSLHDPVWLDHMPYLPFPSTWPEHAPGQKLGNWMESYADALDLNCWTSSKAVKASQDANNMWHVTVEKANGTTRIFVVKHTVFAMGYWGGDPNMPQYPGMDKFKGQIVHSLSHGRATDHIGKKVVVVGSGSAAHDICEDYCKNGVDVTMFQRSSTYVLSVDKGMKTLVGGLYAEHGVPPVEIADMIDASYPNHFMEGYAYRTRFKVEEADKELLEGLRKRGFKLNRGYRDLSGLYLLAWTRGGGYYVDTGASQMIIDGKIKLKNDSQIKAFTENGLLFENGSEVPADVVVFGTGLGHEPRDGIRRICGDEVADKCIPIWGLDEEGEVRGAWREIGPPNLYYMMGTLYLSRFYSKHLALQIKAKEEGIFGAPYSAQKA